MIEERATSSAAEFWDVLAPQRPLFGAADKLLYRGQANAAWPLTPSILRHPENKRGVRLGAGGFVSSDLQVFKEWVYLKSFVDHCDLIGLVIPNDTREFRDQYLNQNAPAGPGRAFIETSLWPDPRLYDLMALGQHHGLPTRLLDWSTRSYVAAYFAISDALKEEKPAERLAVWVLNITRVALLTDKLKTIRVPGGNSANLAAQGGMFTLLRQEGGRGQPFQGETSLDEHFIRLKSPIPIPLVKVTLPVSEAAATLALCELYGVTGATVFPDFYGAARAARDIMRTGWRVEGSRIADNSVCHGTARIA